MTLLPPSALFTLGSIVTMQATAMTKHSFSQTVRRELLCALHSRNSARYALPMQYAAPFYTQHARPLLCWMIQLALALFAAAVVYSCGLFSLQNNDSRHLLVSVARR